MKGAVGLAAGLALTILAAACSTQAASRTQALASPSSPPASLAAAIREAVHLGPASSGTDVVLSLGLKARHQDQLASLLAAGKTVSPTEYAASFGPDPALVGRALYALNFGGLHAAWRPGSNLIAADGPAPAVAGLFQVDIEAYRLANGNRFYASLDTPRLPATIAAVVTSVTGLDDYRRVQTYAVPAGGLVPNDVLLFYNLKPLRDAGLDGAGETIVLPEIDDLPNLSDLNKFAKEFGLPAYDAIVQVKRDPTWGTPLKPQGETVLDLEIIHQIAPAANLVVYESAPDLAHADRAFDQLVSDHLGSVISESLGECEANSPSGHRNLYASIEDRAVAQGMSHFVASGDRGAYTCGEKTDLSPSFPSTLPSVTAVGGTSVFESKTGLYLKESSWSAPISQSGSGGGPSAFYPLPDYQRNVAQAAGHGHRQVPDVAADGDPATGFHIVFAGRDLQAGGTSASAPLWAATVALIDENLKKNGLRETGFANPAIYWMGQNSARLPAPPYHDVTTGNNLAFDAGPGWDFATGWGSMDGAALAAAWMIYIKSGGA